MGAGQTRGVGVQAMLSMAKIVLPELGRVCARA